MKGIIVSAAVLFVHLTLGTDVIADVSPFQTSLPHIDTILTYAQFDDRPTTTEPAIGNPLPVPYKFLNFKNLGIGTPGLLNATNPGVRPKSLPNEVGNGPRRRLQDGMPSITVTGTTTPSFRLKKFYFGCLAQSDVQQAPIAGPCNITVSGTKKNGGKLGPKKFVFDPKLVVTNAPMALAEFDTSWTTLTTVDLAIVEPFLIQLLGTLELDNVTYTV